MDLFYNVGDVADGGMMAGPLSSSKKSCFLLPPLTPEQEHGLKNVRAID
jgi:hypothetical protein